MKGIRIRWHAVVPALGVLAGIVTSPQVLAVLPQKAALAITAISGLIAAFTPAVATNRPPSDPPPSQFRS